MHEAFTGWTHRPPPRPGPRGTAWWAVVMALAGGVGCHGDPTGPTPLAPAQLYWRLVLTHHAITMALTAPYDTLQLRVTPQSATGAVLSDTEPTTYASSDTALVTVSPTGLVTARATGNGITVIARHRHAGLTLSDTAYVTVNDVTPVPVFTTMTLTPVEGDSAVIGLSFQYNNYNIAKDLQQLTLDQAGTPIDNVVVRYYSADPMIVSFEGVLGYTVDAQHIGATLLTSEATIYGVRRVDSLRYAVGYPVVANVEVLPRVVAGRTTVTGYFDPGTVTINVGGVVAWYSDLANGQPTDVVFDEPAAAQPVDSVWFNNNVPLATIQDKSGHRGEIPIEGGGNFTGLVNDSTCLGDTFADTQYGFPCSNGTFYYHARARLFTTPGTYPYHSTLYGTGGVIHVSNNP